MLFISCAVETIIDSKRKQEFYGMNILACLFFLPPYF